VQVALVRGIIYASLGRKVSITAARWFIAWYSHLCALQANPLFLFGCFWDRKRNIVENLLCINFFISVILPHHVIYEHLLKLIYFASDDRHIANDHLWHQAVDICTTVQQSVCKKVKPVTALSQWVNSSCSCIEIPDTAFRINLFSRACFLFSYSHTQPKLLCKPVFI
jgi:hypothetical protein